MNVESLFLVQFSLSLVAWGFVAISVVAPWLATKSRREALLWLSLPHAFRHVGLVFLVPGVVDQTLPSQFALPAAYGDLVTGLLALLALVALARRWALALSLVWIFNVVGAVDLVNALRHLDVAASLGAAWYIPTLLVPLLLITHLMMFKRLLLERGEDEPAASVIPQTQGSPNMDFPKSGHRIPR